MSTEEKSATIGALAKALAAAQGELEDAKKDASNPAFKGSKYATLASVRAALSKVLPKHDLAVVQGFEPSGDDGVCIVTTLMHSSGEWIRSAIYMPVTKKDAQGFGSACTYGRRYSLAAIVGVASDDDDDGNAAVRPNPPPTPRRLVNSGFADPAVAAAMDGYAADIAKAADLKSLMVVYASVQVDPHLAPDAREFIQQKLSTRRLEIESRPRTRTA